MTEPLPDFDRARRLARVGKGIEAQALSALLITRLVNVRYLTGFSGSAGMLLLLAGGPPVLMTDGRYTTQAKEELAIDAEIRVRGTDGYRPLLQELVPPGRLGLEAETTSWAELRRFEEWLTQSEKVPTQGLVESVRQVKDEGELARIARAVEIGDQAFELVISSLGPGRTELEVAASIEMSFKELGASGPSFESIVAAGERSAMPHARPTCEQIRRGDFVVLDFGCVVDGYCSDMSRTVVVGEPTPRQREIYELVSEAQEAARAAVRPGVEAGDVDEAARRVLREAGYGDAFSHSVGHGVGLEIHEAPWVRSASTDILEPGHVVTDEPGVYVEGFGGVRIEDQLVVTHSGPRTLTRSPKDLDSLVIR
jgi:Xaa-Pro aminopeptidase